nr:unnamed protein product [Spirometra erinaceieuropaei]
MMTCVEWNFELVPRFEFVPNGSALDSDLYYQQLHSTTTTTPIAGGYTGGAPLPSKTDAIPPASIKATNSSNITTFPTPVTNVTTSDVPSGNTFDPTDPTTENADLIPTWPYYDLLFTLGIILAGHLRVWHTGTDAPMLAPASAARSATVVADDVHRMLNSKVN